MRRRAFTLIELLTVMAITAVLMTLIVLPIFQSFTITRTAQAFADAQDKARLIVDKISREVGNAVAVRDSADTVAVIPGIGDVRLPYTKLDLILPAQGDPADRDPVSGAFRNPKSGKFDPTLTRSVGDIRLPVAAGMTFTRWWVGLNNPAAAYNEPYTGILMARNGDRDNLYVLRRAEIQPFIWRPRKDNAANSTAWRPNLRYFHSDDKVNNTQEFDTRIVDLDDPYFFVRDGQYLPEGATVRVNDPDNGGIPGKNTRVDNWAKASVVQTELSRYDMIRPAVKGSPAVFDPAAGSKVIPLVQFRPTTVTNAPAAGSAEARPGEASEGLDKVGPDTYTTARGLWTNAIVRYYPAAFLPGAVEIASVNQLGGVSINFGGYNSAGLDGINVNDPFQLFDLVVYERALARGDAYPFTLAAMAADASDQANPALMRRWTPEDTQRRLFTPFRVVTSTGKIVTSFPVEQVGVNALSGASRPNLPFVTTLEGRSPALDNGAGAVLTPAAGAYDVNKQFNFLWNAYPAFQGLWQRSIDLRFVPNEDGTYSPLCPVAASGEVRGFSFPLVPGDANHGAVNRVRITPGSEEVYGPDQNPGVGYGLTVRYSRVAENPGPNQYRINYSDLPEPTNAVSGYVDYAALGFDTTGFDAVNYKANNFVSAVVQPRFKAGYLQLCSDPNVPIPPATAEVGHTGRITVKYRFQFNGPDDSFVVDHDTREIMQILLTIKNYPQSSVPQAQTITLKSTATLRNALR